ncbi:phosphoenolpyruvate synthase [Latilactobacillus sakei]
MAKTWKSGDVIAADDMNRIEAGLGVAGPAGTAGKNGKDGLSIKEIALTKDEAGLITGGTATLTDDSTVAITVK